MKLRTLAAPLALVVGLSACATIEEQDTIDRSEEEAVEGEAAEGDAAAATGDEMAAEYPVTIESDAGETVIEARPENIVSLSPSATEVLFAIGAGDQVVAVDEFSTTPEEAPVTDLSGFDPNVEAIAGYDPDLVIASGDSNDMVASLNELDIPVLVYGAPADIEGGFAQMADLGVATDHVDETAETIATLREDVNAALEAAPEDASPRVYHELDDTYFSASSDGFVGSIYAELGATNIADEADTDGSGFPQLTEEYILEADPEVIVITDQVGYTAEDVANRPGWDEITAVQEGNIITVNADIASRWGPRLPQFIDAAAEALDAAAVPVG